MQYAHWLMVLEPSWWCSDLSAWHFIKMMLGQLRVI
jgi:hypothetical protein